MQVSKNMTQELPELSERNLNSQVYDCELEKVEGFAEFNDFVQSFPLERGKAMDSDDELDLAGEFKGSFRIYPLPHDTEAELPPRIFNALPESSPSEVLLRVYIVRAIDLQPQDEGGAVSRPQLEFLDVLRTPFVFSGGSLYCSHVRKN